MTSRLEVDMGKQPAEGAVTSCTCGGVDTWDCSCGVSITGYEMVDLEIKKRFPVIPIFMTSPNWFSGQNNFSLSDTGVRRPRHESDHSLDCIADVKNAWNSTSTPPRCKMLQDRNNLLYFHTERCRS